MSFKCFKCLSNVFSAKNTISTAWKCSRLFLSFICVLQNVKYKQILLHKKWSFPVTISSENVTNISRIWSHLLKKSLMKNLIFCEVHSFIQLMSYNHHSIMQHLAYFPNSWRLILSLFLKIKLIIYLSFMLKGSDKD